MRENLNSRRGWKGEMRTAATLNGAAVHRLYYQRSYIVKL